MRLKFVFLSKKIIMNSPHTGGGKKCFSHSQTLCVSEHALDKATGELCISFKRDNRHFLVPSGSS